MSNNVEDYESKEYADMKAQKMAIEKAHDEYMQNLILRALYGSRGEGMTVEQIRGELKRLIREV